jgi:hypothetical protein
LVLIWRIRSAPTLALVNQLIELKSSGDSQPKNEFKLSKIRLKIIIIKNQKATILLITIFNNWRVERPEGTPSR